MHGYSPPRRVLLEFCRKLSFCKVDGEIINTDSKLDWEQALDGVEWMMAAILNEYGPVMSRKHFQEKCLEYNINENTFFIYLIYSPIITKYAIGVYGLRGAKIEPGVIESLKTKKESIKALLDFGWKDGNIWLGLRISKAMLDSGVFTVPIAMKKYLQGNFSFYVADDKTFIGNVKVKDARAWNIKRFFQRRGGEVNDYIVLTFDIGTREIKGYIGDMDLLDKFRIPE